MAEIDVETLGRDAQAWARAFMSEFGEDRERIDEGTMIGWFANAIERSTDALTFNQLGERMHAAIAFRRAEARLLPDERADLAGRDLALANTHLEDALTRYNSARYHALGTWQRRDPDLQ